MGHRELAVGNSDPNITILFEKGDRSQCGNYRGISLLSVVGKLFAEILLQRLKRVAEKFCPQSQSAYRESRSTIDGILTLRQLMGKTKNNVRICTSYSFTKAFDTMNREFLFKILGKHQTRRSLINPSQCLSIS